MEMMMDNEHIIIKDHTTGKQIWESYTLFHKVQDILWKYEQKYYGYVDFEAFTVAGDPKEIWIFYHYRPEHPKKEKELIEMLEAM